MKLFASNRRESLYTRLWRTVYNVLPPIRGTGSWLTFISEDWHELHLRMGLNLRTRNYVGTIFGGAMFAATDPLFMVMHMKILGKDYVVWDKAGSIRFIRPGKERLIAKFELSESALSHIRQEVAEQGETDRVYVVTWLNRDGKPVARIEKTLYIADKSYYKQKRSSSASRKNPPI